MKPIKLGIIREGKKPADKRVPLTPKQCCLLMEKYPYLSIFAQSSPFRCYTDDEYRAAGVSVVDEVNHCEILMGVKEVPIDQLIPNKTYFFFSHTIKQQPHNKKLLQSVLQKNITLIDYECLTDNKQERVVAFGKYAGIVGAYNGIMTYGKRFKLFDLKPAHQCYDLNNLKEELQKAKLPPIKIVLTGRGRVAQGAAEILDASAIKRVSPADYLNLSYDQPVYTMLGSSDYYTRLFDQPWDSDFFYKNPGSVKSTFQRFLPVSDILIAAAFWHPDSPALFGAEDMRSPAFKIKVIADITCDINGSIPSTKKSTTISDPVYDFNPSSEEIEEPYSSDTNITVMAIDNLPCELPRDASEFFGNQLIDNVLPHLLENNENDFLMKATIAKEGKLTKSYLYLNDYVLQS